MGSRLRGEIKQTRPFRTLEEEAILNVHRTSSVLDLAVGEALKAYGLSSPQYNVLRILRGAGVKGWACQQIAERMVTRDPDITRLLDRLEGRELIERARSREDRRVVRVRITRSGTKLVASLDSSMASLAKKALGHLGARRVRQLIALLELARERP